MLQNDDSGDHTAPSPRLPAVTDKGPTHSTPGATTSIEDSKEVDHDWEAKENLADQRISRLETDIENLQSELEVAREEKQISADMRKRKADWRTKEEEAMRKLRRLSAHPSPRMNGSRPGLIGAT